jgi:type I restriction enzyme S subunit
VAHVQRNQIDLSIGLRYFEVSQSELERLRLILGDLLIIEGNGSLEQIGRSAIFNGEVENCVHQNHVIRARPNRECVLPKYLNAFLNSPAGQEEVQKRSRTTSGLRTLSVGKIKEIEIPLPSLETQGRIVEQLQLFKSQTDHLLTTQVDCLAEAESLLPAFLDRVFQGSYN